MGIHSREARQAKIMPAGSVRTVNPMVSVSRNRVHSNTVPFRTSRTMLKMVTNMITEAMVLQPSRTLGHLRLHPTSRAARKATPIAIKGLGSVTIILETPPVTLT